MATAKKQYKGRFDHVLDDKYRVIVPIDWRETLGEKITLCRSLNGTPSIWGFSEPEFDEFYDEASDAVPEGDLEGQRQLRFLSSTSSTIEMDKQGRIPLSKDLRDYAVISADKSTKVTIVGNRRRFEIWDPEKLEEDLRGVNPVNLLNNIDKLREKASRPE